MTLSALEQVIVKMKSKSLSKLCIFQICGLLELFATSYCLVTLHSWATMIQKLITTSASKKLLQSTAVKIFQLTINDDHLSNVFDDAQQYAFYGGVWTIKVCNGY